MKITIAAIGKMRAREELALFDSFKKRLPYDVVLKELVEKKNLPVNKLKESEGRLLLGATPKNAKKIILDERGKNLSSIEFAGKLKDFADGGDSHIALLIGGAHGHSDEVKAQADLSISFGKMTWPHMICRIMLIEQIYRAYTINSGHPYHKE